MNINTSIHRYSNKYIGLLTFFFYLHQQVEFQHFTLNVWVCVSIYSIYIFFYSEHIHRCRALWTIRLFCYRICSILHTYIKALLLFVECHERKRFDSTYARSFVCPFCLTFPLFLSHTLSLRYLFIISLFDLCALETRCVSVWKRAKYVYSTIGLKRVSLVPSLWAAKCYQSNFKSFARYICIKFFLCALNVWFSILSLKTPS